MSYFDISITSLPELLAFINSQSAGVFGYTILFIPYMLFLFFFSRRLEFITSFTFANLITLILSIFLAFYNLIPPLLVYVFGFLTAISSLILYLYRH